MLIYKKSLISELTAAYKPVALDIDAFTVEVNVDIEQTDFEDMQNYSTFLAEVQDNIQSEVIKPVIAEAAKELAAQDRAVYAAAKLGLDKTVKKHKTAAEGVLKQATKDIQEGVQHVLNTGWERVLKLEKNVRVAKIKATVHIVLSCVAIGLSIAALATTPVTAVGAVAGAAGLLQSVGTIVKNMRDLFTKVQDLMEQIQKGLIKYRKKAEELQKKLEKEEAKAEKEADLEVQANEGIKVAASGLTGGLSDAVISKLGKGLPSLDALKSDVGLFETKIDELETSQKGLSKDLNKLIDKASTLVAHYEELEKAFNEYLTDLNSKGAKCPKKVLEGQAKVIMPKKRAAMDYEKQVKEAFKKIEHVRNDVNGYRTIHEEFKDKVDGLVKLNKTEKIALFTKIVVLLGSVALGGAGSPWEKTGDVVTNVYSAGSSIFDAGSETLIDKIGA